MKCIFNIGKKNFYIGQGYSGERCGPWASCFFGFFKIFFCIQDIKFFERNVSVFQLGAKEEQLRNALQSQKQYQQAVQEVTGQLDRLQHSLSREIPSTAHLDKHIRDFQVSYSQRYLNHKYSICGKYMLAIVKKKCCDCILQTQ
jgi:hypothetical protein